MKASKKEEKENKGKQGLCIIASILLKKSLFDTVSKSF